MDAPPSPLSTAPRRGSNATLSDSQVSHEVQTTPGDAAPHEQHRATLGDSLLSPISADHGSSLLSDADQIGEHKPEPQAASTIDHAAPAKKHKSRVVRLFSDNAWLPELSACILSIACMGAIVGVLLGMNDRPLDDWNLMIPPNAVISFIATLAKSAFLMALTEIVSQLKWVHFEHRPNRIYDFELFDAASRGPWGSFGLLVRQHRHAVLASCASSIVVAALLLDPFVQLAIRFPSKEFLTHTDTPSFQLSNTYDPTGPGGSWNETQNDVSASYTHAGMQAAILEGFFDRAIDPVASCPTGNCTFRGVSTLGVCSSCQILPKSNVTVQCTSTKAGTSKGQPHQRTPLCTYTMPSGYNLTADRSANNEFAMIASSEDGSADDGYPQTMWNSTAQFFWDPDVDDPDDFPNLTAWLVRFDAIQLAYGKDFDILPDPTAWRCKLQFCIKTWTSVNVTNGTVTRSEAGEIRLSYVYTDPGEDGSRVGRSMNELVPAPESGNATGTRYWMNAVDYAALGTYLVEVFSSGWYNDGSTTRENKPDDLSDDGPSVTPNFGQQLSEAQNVSLIMNHLAESMTEFIRTRNSTEHPGDAYVWKSYIRVRWAWLALPIALVVLSMVLLVITIYVTKRSGLILWKSSALAALYYSLDGWQNRDLHVGDRRELETKAKGMFGRTHKEEHMLVTSHDI